MLTVHFKSKRTRAVFALLFLGFLQIAPAQNPPSANKENPDRLIVYGEGFAFGVKEPKGWQADTGDLAREDHVNVLFEPTHQTQRDQITIRVRVNSKVDENTIEDLNYDMEQYKKDYAVAKFSDLPITHPEYKTFAKLIYVPGGFYEYVAYVNPGTASKFNFSVAMSKKAGAATPQELKAFETVLKSLVWLSNAPIQK